MSVSNGEGCVLVDLPFIEKNPKTKQLSTQKKEKEGEKRVQQQEKQQRSLGEHFVPLPLPSFPDADFHFNCVKALFLTSEKMCTCEGVD